MQALQRPVGALLQPEVIFLGSGQAVAHLAAADQARDKPAPVRAGPPGPRRRGTRARPTTAPTASAGAEASRSTNRQDNSGCSRATTLPRPHSGDWAREVAPLLAGHLVLGGHQPEPTAGPTVVAHQCLHQGQRAAALRRAVSRASVAGVVASVGAASRLHRCTTPRNGGSGGTASASSRSHPSGSCTGTCNGLGPAPRNARPARPARTSAPAGPAPRPGPRRGPGGPRGSATSRPAPGQSTSAGPRARITAC